MHIVTNVIKIDTDNKEITKESSMYLDIGDWGYDKLTTKVEAKSGKLLNSIKIIEKIIEAEPIKKSTEESIMEQKSNEEENKNILTSNFIARLDTDFAALKVK